MTGFAYWEWSSLIGTDLDDRESVRAANPAFGTRINEDFVFGGCLALDLSDRVSRVAVAWWVIERGPVTDDDHVLLFTVKNGGHVNRKGQEQLRDMVLRRTLALQDPV